MAGGLQEARGDRCRIDTRLQRNQLTSQPGMLARGAAEQADEAGERLPPLPTRHNHLQERAARLRLQHIEKLQRRRLEPRGRIPCGIARELDHFGIHEMQRKLIAFDSIRRDEHEMPAGSVRCALPLHRTPRRHEARRVLRRRLDIAAGREAAQGNACISGIVQQQEVHAPRAGIAAGRGARLDMHPKVRFQRPEDLDGLDGEGERYPFRRGPVLLKDKADGRLEGAVQQAGMQSIGAGRRRYRIRQAKAGENRALTIRAGSKGKRGDRPVPRPIDEAMASKAA